MATYNGERFLEEQLQSITDQTHAEWHLYIRDDGSTDNTVNIISTFIEKDASRITLIKDDLGGLGASGNFSELMKHSNAPYILFSDQDDIWERDKIKDQLNAIQTAEDGGRLPTYVFSDLTMINDDGAEIAASLWTKDSIDPSRISLNQLLVQNVPYGCATIVNRALLELALPVDERALLHDHWMAILAAAAGKITSLKKATIRHRIHDSNASRSQNPIRKERSQNATAILANKNFNRYFGQLQMQAAAVKERLLERNIGEASCIVLDDFINLRDKKLLARKQLMIRRGFFKHSRLQSLKWLLRI